MNLYGVFRSWTPFQQEPDRPMADDEENPEGDSQETEAQEQESEAQEKDQAPANFLQRLDVIPDDVAVVGELDDAAISLLDDVGQQVIREVADELGAPHASRGSIVRTVASLVKSDENVSRVAQALDDLVDLPGPLDAIDGPIINSVAETLLDDLAERIKERV